MKKTQMQRLAGLVRESFERIGNGQSDVGRRLQTAVSAAMREERQHRAMGRSYANTRYCLSVEDTAYLFVAKWFYLKPIDNMARLVGCREDVIHASIAHAACDVARFIYEYERIQAESPVSLEEWDYARDVAGST